MAKDQRFEKVYSQGMLETTEIWVDKKDRCKLYISHQWKCCRIYTIAGQRRETGSFLCMG